MNLILIFLVSGSFDKTIRIWDVRAKRCFRRVQGHADTIVSCNFNEDAGKLLTAGFDGYIRLWDVQSGNCIQSYQIGNNVPVSFARWSPNYRYILVGSFDDTWRLLNASTGKIAKTYTGHNFNDFCIIGCFFLNMGKWIVSGSSDKSIYIWDINNKEIVQRLEGHKDVVVCVSSHPTKNILASGSLDEDRTVKLWKSGSDDS